MLLQLFQEFSRKRSAEHLLFALLSLCCPLHAISSQLGLGQMIVEVGWSDAVRLISIVVNEDRDEQDFGFISVYKCNLAMMGKQVCIQRLEAGVASKGHEELELQWQWILYHHVHIQMLWCHLINSWNKCQISNSDKWRWLNIIYILTELTWGRQQTSTCTPDPQTTNDRPNRSCHIFCHTSYMTIMTKNYIIFLYSELSTTKLNSFI